MRTTLIVVVLYFISSLNFAQTKETTWFPSQLNIRPFTANMLEPKAGFSYLFQKNKIRLDIGTSRDIVHIINGNSTLSFGADLFTYTRIRSQSNFKFPVETIDFFFGINSGYKIVNKNKQYGFRFRFSHISAHLVDGLYNQNQNGWKDNYTPFVYSREFLELFPFYQINTFRAYVGLTYLIHIVPDGIGKGIYQTGFDYYFANVISKNVSPFIADDFKLDYMNNHYFGNNIFSAGIKFGKYDQKGFSILFSYYSGKSIHGLYYSISEHYATLGFNLDL